MSLENGTLKRFFKRKLKRFFNAIESPPRATKQIARPRESHSPSMSINLCSVSLNVLGLQGHVEELVVVTGEHVGRGRLPREAVAGRRTDGVPEGGQVEAGPLGLMMIGLPLAKTYSNLMRKSKFLPIIRISPIARQLTQHSMLDMT